MKRILVLGAGLSSSTLIRYLLNHSEKYNWHVTLADVSLEAAQNKISKHPNGQALQFDINNESLLKTQVSMADVVVSMLPASMHPTVAKECVRQGTHMLTASYISEEMKALDQEAKQKGVLLLNELGLDPGIDHMSSMKLIDELKSKGGELIQYVSNTGGLIAPEYDTNPWHYKFTWNPMNVVLAGKGGAKYKEYGHVSYLPYHRVFTRLSRINVLNYGEFEVYPNRDSLKYGEIYKLENPATLFRGTIRRPGFSKAWQTFVLLGLTDDSYVMNDSEHMTYREFINRFLPYDKAKTVEEKLAELLHVSIDSEEKKKLNWLGIFEKKPIGLSNASPAQILQHILRKKWMLEADDKDMIVMQHQLEYELGGKRKKISSSLLVKGQDQQHTAMSIAVGTPLAIAVKLLLNGQITARGVHLPVLAEIYMPVLAELEHYGIKFIEEEVDV